MGEVAIWAEVKDDNGNLIVHAETECGSVHDAESVFQTMLEGNGFKAFGIQVLAWIRAVNAIYLSGFKDHIGCHFTGAESGGCIGGKEGAASSCSKDDDGFLG